MHGNIVLKGANCKAHSGYTPRCLHRVLISMIWGTKWAVSETIGYLEIVSSAIEEIKGGTTGHVYLFIENLKDQRCVMKHNLYKG